MEIERKFLIRQLPENYKSFPHKELEQGYLCTDPVMRVRREGDTWYMTYKGRGLLSHEEYNLPLTREGYEHLIKKADGIIITKTRYLIPCPPYMIELDEFHGVYEGLIFAEVEFPDEEAAHAFCPPEWLGEDVTYNNCYYNSNMSQSADWWVKKDNAE
ncbi:MAG: CYTH domain-containing protein [Lachnospiraceae bacterium]|nr:CYTH domain-containing protein [Lachnospiraceae bacterium]